MKKIRLFLLLFVLLMISLWGCRGASSDGSPADKADEGEQRKLWQEREK